MDIKDLTPRAQVTIIVVTSLGFIIGWAWSEFFKKFFNTYIDPHDINLSNFIYAILVTIIVIIVAWILLKFIVDRK